MRVGDASTRDGKITTDLTPETKLSKKDAAARTRPVAEDVKSADGPSPFARILQGLGREVDRGESVVRRATHGATSGQELGSMELLALQAGVYRYSEAVDLSAKLVDRAANGVKTVLQGQ